MAGIGGGRRPCSQRSRDTSGLGCPYFVVAICIFSVCQKPAIYCIFICIVPHRSCTSLVWAHIHLYIYRFSPFLIVSVRSRPHPLRWPSEDVSLDLLCSGLTYPPLPTQHARLSADRCPPHLRPPPFPGLVVFVLSAKSCLAWSWCISLPGC